MRLTLRGWVVVAVIAFSLWTSARYGPRSLNAVVVPATIVVLAGVVSVARISRPSVERTTSSEGVAGDGLTIEHVIDGDRTVSATLSEAADGELYDVKSDGDPTTETVLEAGVQTRFEYELHLEKRGTDVIGPLSIVVTDVFGLVARRFDDDGTTSLVVVPPTKELRAGPTERLLAPAVESDRDERAEFDHLREYRRGDSLRDVHWKSTAKRADDGLFVTEYVAEGDAGSVTIALECVEGRADELATAAASVADSLLERGVRVGLVRSDGGAPLAPGTGREHRRDVLEILAVVDSGELAVDTRREADVRIRADESETTVSVGDVETSFERLRRGRDHGREFGPTVDETRSDDPGMDDFGAVA
ncbi:DUF58 domain-containing protein [Natrarchaeobius halalkaliphilus]|uniref:DUF58 domain-containing protein n=1 Tax=Natrarchaeobius halalkaliphilus TaxID=1679091 RepID=UPI00140514B3|nr:DUF58 domain-containing protein [Natrarchaeobius halalkaliphilus]